MQGTTIEVIKGGYSEFTPWLIWPERIRAASSLKISFATARGASGDHLSHSLNSLKGGYIVHYIGNTFGVIKGDTRSLDYSSFGQPAC